MQNIMSIIDLLALVWFFTAYIGYWLATRLGPLAGRSIATEIQRQRVLWMRCMMSRENRLLDAHVMAQLSSGHAFFASTSIIVIGGLSAAFGALDDIKRLLEELPFVAQAPIGLLQLKLMLMIVLFVVAFFQFAWAYRLAHYTGITIASAPFPPSDDETANARHARRIARLAGISAEQSTNGLRTYYFAIAATTWFLHPIMFILAVTSVTVLLYHREYRSRAFKTIARLSEMTSKRE